MVAGAALATILRHHGFEVVHARTLAEGLHHLTDNPMFVLLDLMLPDGDGTTILKKIRELKMDSRVLVTTAVSDPAWLNAVRSLQPEMVIQKPIDLHRLLHSMDLPN